MVGGGSGSGDWDGELKLTLPRSQERVVLSRWGCRVQPLLTTFLAECSHKFADHHGEGELIMEENIVSETPPGQHLGVSLRVQLLHRQHTVVVPCQDLRDSLMDKTLRDSGLSSR